MMSHMRTTLTIEDSIAKELKDQAHRKGKSFKQVVNETLQAGLQAGKTPTKRKPYRIKPVSIGLEPGINIDKALQLSDEMEDEEIIRKLELKK